MMLSLSAKLAAAADWRGSVLGMVGSMNLVAPPGRAERHKAKIAIL